MLFLAAMLDTFDSFYLQEAFAVLGIPDDEKMGMYRTTSAVMQFGEMKFKQRPREEQAEADGSAEAEKVRHDYQSLHIKH